jgi:hypothetical protein
MARWIKDAPFKSKAEKGNKASHSIKGLQNNSQAQRKRHGKASPKLPQLKFMEKNDASSDEE